MMSLLGMRRVEGLPKMLLLLFPMVLNSIAQSWPSTRPEMFSYSRGDHKNPLYSRFTPYMTEDSLPKPIYGEIPTYLREKVGPRPELPKPSFSKPNFPEIDKYFPNRHENPYTYRNPYEELGRGPRGPGGPFGRPDGPQEGPRDGPNGPRDGPRDGSHDRPPYGGTDGPHEPIHKPSYGGPQDGPHGFHGPHGGPPHGDPYRPPEEPYGGPPPHHSGERHEEGHDRGHEGSQERPSEGYDGPRARHGSSEDHGYRSRGSHERPEEQRYRGPPRDRSGEEAYHGPPKGSREHGSHEREPEHGSHEEKYDRPQSTPRGPETSLERPETSRPYPGPQNPPPGTKKTHSNAYSPSQQQIPADKTKPGLLFEPRNEYGKNPPPPGRVYNVTAASPLPFLDTTIRLKKTYDPRPTSDPYSQLFEPTDGVPKGATHPPKGLSYESTYVPSKYSPLEGPYPGKGQEQGQGPYASSKGQQGPYPLGNTPPKVSEGPYPPENRPTSGQTPYEPRNPPLGPYEGPERAYAGPKAPRPPPTPSAAYIPENQKLREGPQDSRSQELPPRPPYESKEPPKSSSPEEHLPPPPSEESSPKEHPRNQEKPTEKPKKPPPPKVPSAQKVFENFNFGSGPSLINDFFQFPEAPDESKWNDDNKKEKEKRDEPSRSISHEEGPDSRPSSGERA